MATESTRTSLTALATIGALALIAALPGCLRFSVDREQNEYPSAFAGEDQSVLGGEQASLSGSGEDTDGDTLEYAWAQLAGDPVQLSSTSSAQTTFVAPRRAQTLVFSLVVNDGLANSAPDLVEVRVDHNEAPSAQLPGLIETFAGQPVRLEPGGDDPDGDPLVEFLWEVALTPTGVEPVGLLSDPAARNPIFTPPSKGDYLVTLTVSDGQAWSDPATMTIVALNNPPIARIDSTPVLGEGSRYQLSADGSSDPDGDAIIGHAWNLVQAPAGGVASFVGGIDNAAVVTVELLGSGVFVFALVVTDSDGGDSLPASVNLDGNRPPVLSLNRTTALAVEGSAFGGIDASGSLDPDGDAITITWSKSSGGALFPQTLAGPAPALVAPSFRALQEAGGDNSASYEVTATDGRLSSAAQRVVFYVLPSSDNYVVLSSGAGATPDPGCGSVSSPCATLTAARAELDVGDGYGDGRTLLATSGSFPHHYEMDAGPPHGLVWLGGVDILGGFDPETFAPGARSVIPIARGDGNCLTTFSGLILNNKVRGALLSRLEISYDIPCGNYGVMHTVLCDNCEATIEDSSFTLLDGGSVAHTIEATGGGAVLTVRRSALYAGSHFQDGVGLFAQNGARVLVEDSLIHATGNLGQGVVVTGDASLELLRSVVLLTGSPASDALRNVPLRNNGGVILVRRSGLVNAQHPDGPVVRQISGSGVLAYSTLVGIGAGTQSGSGVHAASAITLYGNLIQGASLGVHLTTEGAKASRLYGNALSSASGVLVRCDAADLLVAAVVNGGDGLGCNDSGEAWADNLALSCPLVDPLAGDMHLNTLEPNGCVDTGAESSPVGLVPALDVDGEAWSGVAPDLGCDEAS